MVQEVATFQGTEVGTTGLLGAVESALGFGPADSNQGMFGAQVLAPQDFYNNFKDVVGLPHHFLDTADPSTRAFTRHMLQSPPLVMIRPGRVKYTDTAGLQALLASALTGPGTTQGQMEQDLQSIFTVSGASNGTIFDLGQKYGVDASDLAALNTALKQKLFGSVQDFSSPNGASALRYFEFDPHVDEYMSVVATMSARLYSRMTVFDPSNPLASLPWLSFDRGDGPKASNYGGFITYWADNASSVSESATAEVGATAVQSAVSGISEASRQAQFFMGTNASDPTLSAPSLTGGALTDIQNYLSGSHLGITSGVNGVKASGVGAALGDAILGLQPLFPQVWKNSAFNRSYDISFKFFSPYGAPGAVYKNVLLPFAQLLSLVLPVARNPGTYSEPFVFQLDCPGHFACDLGICTGFTFTRGGPDHLWTKDGLPRQIDVSMQVTDLYPTLMASHNNASLYCNVGLGTFLDNLAAINLFVSTQATSPLRRYQSQIERFITLTEQLPSTLKAYATNAIFSSGLGGVAALFQGIAGNPNPPN